MPTGGNEEGSRRKQSCVKRENKSAPKERESGRKTEGTHPRLSCSEGGTGLGKPQASVKEAVGAGDPSTFVQSYWLRETCGKHGLAHTWPWISATLVGQCTWLSGGCHSWTECLGKGFAGIVSWDTVPGDINKCLLSPESELTTDQRRDTINIQLGQPVSFMGVTYRNRGVSKTAASPDPLPPHRNWKPETYCTTCRQLSMLGACPFQGAQLFWASCLCGLYCLHVVGEGGA